MLQLFLSFLSFIISSGIIFFCGERENILLMFLHLCIILICSVSLFLYKGRPFSIFKIVHLFFLFFLGIAPFLQYENNVVFWGGKSFTDNDYAFTSFILLCVLLIYNTFYSILCRNKKTLIGNRLYCKLSNPIAQTKVLSRGESIIFILLAFLCFVFVLYINKFNVFALFFRGGDIEGGEILEKSISISKSLSLIVNNFFRPMVVVLFLVAVSLKCNVFVKIILAMLMLLVACPTAMPRFSVAAMYIPVLFLSFKSFKKPNVFVFMFILGLLVLFPFLNNFRNYSDEQSLKMGFDFKMFLEGHFDTYSSLLRVVTYDIDTNGMQLVGCLLFWVPRSIWPTKPIGSGAYLSEVLHLSFDNISCCYFAEGYINGGFIGIFIFTVVLAFFSASFDNLYWSNQKNNNTNVFFELLYFFLLGLTFFILRGDLLSSFAYTVGFSCSILFVFYILLYKRKYRVVLNKSEKVF